jgi:hypothetical protein
LGARAQIGELGADEVDAFCFHDASPEMFGLNNPLFSHASPAQMGNAGASCFLGGKEIGPGIPHSGEVLLDI